MFSVIISEKGGAERREVFDRNEINVGRVQGNDLTLPKGNVSKRHARLLFRDGRFIVTDLKSTNGTYVNGRKISQATIVREGDKIYIGDFVLRVEPGAAGAGAAQAPVPPPEDSLILIEPDPPSAPAAAPVNGPTAGQASVGAQAGADAVQAFKAELKSAPIMPGVPGIPQGPAIPTRHVVSEPPSSQDGVPVRATAPRPGEIVSHFPLEHDPDEAALLVPPVPGPPRVPSAAARVNRGSLAPSHRVPSSHETVKSSGSMAPDRTPLPSPYGDRGAALQGSSPPMRRAIPPAPIDPSRATESSRAASHRAALIALIDRVGELVDLRALDSGAAPDEATVARVERALGERIGTMKALGELRPEIDADALVVEARREILEHGPLMPLLDDEDVTEIQVLRSDYVVAMQGRRQFASEIGFSSEQAVARVIRRLCVASGRPLAEGEVFVERRLPRGARMFAVLPPASTHGHMLVLRKPQRADLTLEDLVRSGTISRAMAGFFAQCVEARANILVTGAVGSGATALVGALAAAGSTDDRVVLLEEDDELVVTQPHTIAILLGESAAEQARAIQAAARARPDRLVVGAFAGTVAAEVVDVIGDGADGVLAAARAPTLRQAVARLTADVAATRPGLDPEVAREWLASAFDLVIEVARLRDGRHRVLRVAELAVEGPRVVLRDVFTFGVERTAAGGTVEGTFHPTGLIPAIVEDLAARGVSIDTSIFKRHAGRSDNPSSPR